MGLKSYTSAVPFHTERGETLPQLEIAYHTYGTLNAAKDNVIWICHALTASSDAADWWNAICGSGKILNPENHFIVCANILGSCYGTSGPESINPKTRECYGKTFPLITIRDIVNAHILLRRHLGIERIRLCLGGSMGGYQVLEWALAEKDVIEKLFLIATGAAESAWGIAIHTAQRLAIEAEQGWNSGEPGAGNAGLKAARAIGMLTYRNYSAFVASQTDTEPRLDQHKAESYIHYQGEKLVRRFSVRSYHLLTRAMDSHHLGRGRESVSLVLAGINIPALIVGISSDMLCPLSEQKMLSGHMPQAVYREIDSSYGHDGFLIEGEKLSGLLAGFLKQ